MPLRLPLTGFSVTAVVASLLLWPAVAQATATGIEVTLSGDQLRVTGHPGGVAGDIEIVQTPGEWIVRITDGSPQLWNADASCLPSTGADAMEVRCTRTVSTAKASVRIDMTQSTNADDLSLLFDGTAETTFLGSPQGDVYEGGDGPDTIRGGAGDDILMGGNGSDVVSGGAGADDIDVEDGAKDTVDCNDDASRGTRPNEVAYDAGLDVLTDCGTGSLTPPKNTARPTILGTPTVGSPVTGTLGSWEGSDLTYSYKWASCVNSANPYTDCKDVLAKTADKSGLSYTPKDSDVGRLLLFAVYAKNAGGEVEMTSGFSAAVKPSQDTKPVNVVKPAIPTPVEVNKQSTASPGTWQGRNITFTYWWRICETATTPVSQCVDPVGVSDADQFTPSPKDKGKYLRVIVTATNAKGSMKSVSEPQLVELVTVPDPPASLTWTRLSDTKIELQWTLPAKDGGRPVSSFRLEYWAYGGTWATSVTGDWAPVGSGTFSQYSTTFDVVSMPVAQYWFRVAAINARGRSGWTVLFPVSTSPPPAPLRVSGQRNGDFGARLWWDQPSYTLPSKDTLAGPGRMGDILEWQVEYRSMPLPVNTGQWSAWAALGSAKEPTMNVNSLSANTRYQFRVRASNLTGWGPWAEGSYLNIDDKTTPSEVRNIAVETAGDQRAMLYISGKGGQLYVSWEAPLDDGMPGNGGSLDYTATASPGGASCSYRSQVQNKRMGCVIAKLTDGQTYTITVSVSNGGGGSSVTSAGDFIPYGEPGTPTLVGKPAYGTKGRYATATIRWTWPVDKGGFTEYWLEILDKDSSGKWVSLGTCTSAQATCTIEGLAKGKSNTMFMRVGTPRLDGPTVAFTVTPPR